jgi:type II secretory pathway predicted ATPase ExeA
MIAARLQNPLPAEPFADDAAGLSYFATDFHYEHLVARLRRHLASTRGFYLVSGTPAPDGDLVERAINGRKEAPQRATLVRCRAGMTVDAVTRAYARQLGLTDERDNGQWALLSRLMEDSRKGVVRVLVLENADALDDRGFDELHRFATLDDPHFLPVVLLTERSFAQRLDAPSLQFLQPAIVAHLALQQLETEEVAAFIRYQLNATEGRHERVFTREAIAQIAAAAKGDPAAVNRLARQAAGIAAPATPAAPPQLVAPAPKPVPPPAPAKIEPRLTLRPGETARPATLQPAANGAVPPVPAPSTAKAAVPAKPPAIATARKSTAPVASFVVASLMRARAMAPAATIAGYVVLAAASAAGLFYLLAPGAERRATVVAEAPQVQTVITGDLPVPAPRRVKPAAAEALPAIPAVPESVAADAPPAAPEPPAAAAAPAPNVAEQAPSPLPAVTPTPVPALAAIEPTAGAKPPAESVAKPEAAPTPAPIPSSMMAKPTVETVVKAAPAPAATPATPPAAAVVEQPPSAPATPSAEIVAKAEPAPLPPSAAATPPAASVAKLEADPAPLPPRPADKPPSGAAAALVRRGEALLASGDIISARQFFARAAETGDAAAACGLGKSYDPLVLRQVGTRGVAGDPAKAVNWYRRAAHGGSNEAAARLARLLVKFPQ